MNAQHGTAPWILARRFALIAALLGATMWVAGDRLVQGLLPLFRLAIELGDRDHQVERLEFDREGADRVLRLTVSRVRYVIAGGKALAPEPESRASATTLAGHVQLVLVLLLSSAFITHPTSAKAWLRRLAAAAAAALLCMLLDVPLVLMASIWGLYAQALEPDRWSPLLSWSAFMQGGGRYWLPLGMGVAMSALIGAPLLRGKRV